MKRTYKILILLIISLVISYIIFQKFDRKKINYIALGTKIDSKYTYYDYINNYLIIKDKLEYFNDYYIGKYTPLEYIDIIKDNHYELIDGHYITIQQLFRKCDLLTIYLEKPTLKDLDSLIYYLTYYTDCPLILINDKKENEESYELIAKKYKITYLFVEDIYNHSKVGEKIIENSIN